MVASPPAENDFLTKPKTKMKTLEQIQKEAPLPQDYPPKEIHIVIFNEDSVCKDSVDGVYYRSARQAEVSALDKQSIAAGVATYRLVENEN